MKYFNFKILLIPPLIMSLFFLSWLVPQTRFLWDLLDKKTFVFLNLWIQKNVFWQHFWGFSGHLSMDWIHDGIMSLFFFFNIRSAPKVLKKRKIAELIFAAFFIAFSISLINGFIFPEYIHVSRQSPTMVDREAFRLSKVVTWIKVKDHSGKSFPGDHATTAALFSCIIFYTMGWKKGFLSALYAIFFCLPRLITGGHWLTDVFMGSISIAILMSSLAFGTPFGRSFIGFIEWGLKKMPRKKKPKKETLSS